MRRALLALAIVGLWVPMAFAVGLPMMLINPLDGSGVTVPAGDLYSGFYNGGSSLSVTGNAVTPNPVVLEGSSSSQGTTACLVLGTPSTQDFSLYGQISSATRSEVGFGARSTGYYGYILDVNFDAQAFNLIKVTGGAGANLAFDRVPWISATGVYDMIFSLQGNHLVGKLVDASNPGNVDWLSTYDSSDTSGNCGMTLFATAPFAGDSIAPPSLGSAGMVTQGSWNNLDFGSPIAAPEPGTVAMLVAGSLALLGWAGLRRRR